MSDQPQPQIPPGTPLAVSLTLIQWRELLEILAEGQFRRVAPFVGQIERQCNMQIERMMQSAPRRPNGPMLEAEGRRTDA
jgi:hypothetical protein